MFEYCPNCRCRIKFYKAHECEKMKHDLADSVKLAGDAIANGEECKVKENTAHGFFRIWCNIKNIIEIICDIIKRMKCLQRKAQKVCEVQHCLAERIESVNRFIGVYNSDQANKPSPDQSDWEANKKRLESDYQTSLNGYNARKTEYDRALQAYNDSNSNYASALASYNARRPEPFTEQPPQKPTIPPKPEKKVETIPLIKGGCDLMDCKFDCFIDNK